MKRAIVFYCKKIQDYSCPGCVKCFKAVDQKAGAYGQHGEEVRIVAMTSCGDCPGLIMPRASHMNKILAGIEEEFDVIHLGTCMKTATETGNCSLDLEEVKMMLENKFGKPVIIGTHDYA